MAEPRQDYLLAPDDPRVPIEVPQASLIWKSKVGMEAFIGELEVAEFA